MDKGDIGLTVPGFSSSDAAASGAELRTIGAVARVGRRQRVATTRQGPRLDCDRRNQEEDREGKNLRQS